MTRWMVSSALAVAAMTAQVHAEVPHVRCGTPKLLASRPIPRVAKRPAFAAPLADKALTDSFGEPYQIFESPNFAVKWLDATLTEADAQLIADALEQSWATFIDRMGHEPCGTCDAFKINAYITGATETPSIDYAGGYAWVDDAGNPYFVISKDMFATATNRQRVAAVAAHEFYHDVQFGTGSFTFTTTPYGWFWEATAEWAAQHVLPESPDPFVFSGAFALRSELPVYHYGDPFGDDPVEGVHQYGAGIFWRFVTDHFGDDTSLIVDTWEQAGPDAEPMDQVAARLPSSDLAALHTEFAARNAVWDYPYRDFIVQSLDLYRGGFPDLDEIQQRIPAEGAPLAQLAKSPYGFGYTTIEVARPNTGRMAIEVHAPVNPTIELHGTVVFETPGGITYVPMAVDAATGIGTVAMDFPPNLTIGYVVLSVTTPNRVTTFPIALQLSATPVDRPDPDDGDDSGGCQAQRGEGARGALLLLGIAGVLSRLRRRVRSGT